MQYRHIIGLAGFAIGVAVGACGVDAQTYPAKSIRLVVPATPGGAIDVIARLVGDKLQASLGLSVVIENKPGASNNLGTDLVAKVPSAWITPAFMRPPIFVSALPTSIWPQAMSNLRPASAVDFVSPEMACLAAV